MTMPRFSDTALPKATACPHPNCGLKTLEATTVCRICKRDKSLPRTSMDDPGYWEAKERDEAQTWRDDEIRTIIYQPEAI